MGTTLTGTTPQDTYDSLIKVTDNGPLSGTAKYLSDGLGNDSALALSTSRVGINQSNPTVARLEIVESTTAEALRVDGSGSGFAFVVNGGTSYKSAIRNASVGSSYFSTAAPSNGLIVEGNVGIGTSSPATTLAVNGITSVLGGQQLRVYRTDNATYGSIQYLTGAGGFKFDDVNGDGYTFAQGGVTKMSLTSSNVLDLAAGQIKFPATQVPSADANTLDDYEEGTFTPTAFGVTTAGTTTYTGQNGYYTKIGRQVTVSIYVGYSSLTGTGDMRIGGLPFVIGNFTENYPVGSCIPSSVNWTGGTYLQAIGFQNESNLYIAYIADDTSSNVQQCVDEAATFRITMTYFTA